MNRRRSRGSLKNKRYLHKRLTYNEETGIGCLKTTTTTRKDTVNGISRNPRINTRIEQR